MLAQLQAAARVNSATRVLKIRLVDHFTSLVEFTFGIDHSFDLGQFFKVFNVLGVNHEAFKHLENKNSTSAVADALLDETLVAVG